MLQVGHLLKSWHRQCIGYTCFIYETIKLWLITCNSQTLRSWPRESTQLTETNLWNVREDDFFCNTSHYLLLMYLNHYGTSPQCNTDYDSCYVRQCLSLRHVLNFQKTQFRTHSCHLSTTVKMKLMYFHKEGKNRKSHVDSSSQTVYQHWRIFRA